MSNHLPGHETTLPGQEAPRTEQDPLLAGSDVVTSHLGGAQQGAVVRFTDPAHVSKLLTDVDGASDRAREFGHDFPTGPIFVTSAIKLANERGNGEDSLGGRLRALHRQAGANAIFAITDISYQRQYTSHADNAAIDYLMHLRDEALNGYQVPKILLAGTGELPTPARARMMPKSWLDRLLVTYGRVIEFDDAGEARGSRYGMEARTSETGTSIRQAAARANAAYPDLMSQIIPAALQPRPTNVKNIMQERKRF